MAAEQSEKGFFLDIVTAAGFMGLFGDPQSMLLLCYVRLSVFALCTYIIYEQRTLAPAKGQTWWLSVFQIFIHSSHYMKVISRTQTNESFLTSPLRTPRRRRGRTGDIKNGPFRLLYNRSCPAFFVLFFVLFCMLDNDDNRQSLSPKRTILATALSLFFCTTHFTEN